ncbi:hypothetical protein [Parasporobacterium paucivorans]|uniref:Uncharacterized protein n=1 Tax=Parasporobacterium paucivorans DSM 15970 TaxID=1122934 RepID=A0A1M6B230_9FIRM|nr:hypothetical protein [Parasporobacterium paucivorans]SHI42727.1 hypothetical protein SAMN02745691_00238 [Parasporobacterium paucivorans DSM 15970]
MSKHEAMQTYLQDHVTTIAGRVLDFNVGRPEVESISFLTQYANKDIKRYLSGAIREYGFAILIQKPYSVDNDDVNMLAMEMAQGFQDWIDEQNKAKNYPDFGTSCNVTRIESMQNMPNLSGIDESGTVAQYMLQCKVTYYEAK